MRIMQEEIFGPVLPVVTYRDLSEAIAYVNARPRPLALYYFGSSAANRARVLTETTSGGVTINGTLMHYAQDDLPFGGVGASGLGAYHGIEGFRAFSHQKAVFDVGRWNGGALLRPPFGRLTNFIIDLVPSVEEVHMSSFVLVHGAWHGSWCWKRVRAALQAQGHEVFTPTLTGVSDRSHLLSREINLETHIQDVVNLIRWEELTDIVLCGHSYGGCVVSGVADRMPERIRALVYLDAFVLEDGENQLQHLTEALSRQFREGVKSLGEGWKVPPIPAAAFNVNVADREWVDRQCTVQPIGTMEQPLQPDGRHRADRGRQVHPRDRTGRVRPFRRSTRRRRRKGGRHERCHAATTSCWISRKNSHHCSSAAARTSRPQPLADRASAREERSC